MTEDPVLTAVQRFMEAVELRLAKQATENAALREEVRSLMGELQTRAAALPVAGPPGPAGKDGQDGCDGAASIVPGPQGEKGERGPQGERGADGLQGRDGANGKDGERGERGADGIATSEEIEAIVEKRVAEVQVRTFADLYQGVYENGKLYTRGLFTTWGGSLWLSLKDTSGKPGENGDWRLVVKKGADGRK